MVAAYAFTCPELQLKECEKVPENLEYTNNSAELTAILQSAIKIQEINKEKAKNP